jgi:protein gp37
MSDLFHPKVPLAFIEAAFDVMVRTLRHLPDPDQAPKASRFAS